MLYRPVSFAALVVGSSLALLTAFGRATVAAPSPFTAPDQVSAGNGMTPGPIGLILASGGLLAWWRWGRKAAAEVQERSEIEQVIEIMRTAGRDVAPVGLNQYDPDPLEGTAPPLPISRRFQAADAEAEAAQLTTEETGTLEVTTLRDRVRDLEGQLEEAKQERDLARDQLAAVPEPVAELVGTMTSAAGLAPATWHGLIQRAIKMLRAMPENDRHKAMNEWLGAVNLSVVFPQPSRKKSMRGRKSKAATAVESAPPKLVEQHLCEVARQPLADARTSGVSTSGGNAPHLPRLSFYGLPPGTDLEHMWHAMVKLARVTVREAGSRFRAR